MSEKRGDASEILRLLLRCRQQLVNYQCYYQNGKLHRDAYICKLLKQIDRVTGSAAPDGGEPSRQHLPVKHG